MFRQEWMLEHPVQLNQIYKRRHLRSHHQIFNRSLFLFQTVPK
ncbi:hypothetical protein NC652_025843 [Populus alba x Populus x berolinensis]|nr:hypothetical protein NC651_024703 [Populus alba x Populus x berolinensis]KAJ6891311.1 hypothetical protein NC651_024724 [Populus alba x Populus x berolinensis]KAJ6892916.1 hypothetical protein NC651_025968 [Populus alba x Populus x berolinensis]KAJ6899507.1 hypothetical protein NC652_025843 [Populus alba x Populus x berolinensis]